MNALTTAGREIDSEEPDIVRGMHYIILIQIPLKPISIPNMHNTTHTISKAATHQLASCMASGASKRL